MDVTNTGGLPTLQSAWVDFAEAGKAIPMNVEPFPLHQFVLRGFSFFRWYDVTEAESLKQLREAFVHLSTGKESSIYHQFEINIRDDQDKPTLATDNVKAAIVKRMFEQFVAGTSPTEVLKYAKANGFTRSGNSSLMRVLTNPVYAGLLRLPIRKNRSGW